MPLEKQEKHGKWYKTPLLYPASLFGSRSFKKLVVEIGPGRGDYLFHLAKNNPENLYLAIELRSNRYFKLIERTKKQGFGNICLMQDDGRKAIERAFEERSVDEIYVHFPDPWPKRKHTKNRLLNASFMKACAKILVKGGTFSFVTDSLSYFEDFCKMLPTISDSFEKCPDGFEVFPSFFAQKWQREGRKFYPILLKKVDKKA